MFLFERMILKAVYRNLERIIEHFFCENCNRREKYMRDHEKLENQLREIFKRSTLKYAIESINRLLLSPCF